GTEATAGLKVVRIHADGTISPRGRLVYPGGDPIDERFNSVVGAFLPNGNYAIMAVFNLGGGMGQVRRLMQIDVSVTPPVIVSDIEFLGQTSNDWAVNPVDQQLYAYDPDADQMIQINPATGTSALVGLPAGFDLLQGAGSVWFDAFGRFYAFGTRPDAGQQDTLISAFLDPNGVLSPTAPYIVSSGYSPVGGSDGASCPFGVKVDKVVSSSPTGVPSGPGQVATAVAGSTVTYTYR